MLKLLLNIGVAEEGGKLSVGIDEPCHACPLQKTHKKFPHTFFVLPMILLTPALLLRRWRTSTRWYCLPMTN